MTWTDVAERLTAQLDLRLAAADAALIRDYPGERPGRQPVHTVYVPADQFSSGVVADYGAAALRALDEHADAFVRLVRADDVEGTVDDVAGLVDRVRAKLSTEPVEDLRIDFEDGYVGRGDTDEDAEVTRAAIALAADQQKGVAAPFGGIRIKSLEPTTRRRAVRTLTQFVSTLVEHGGSVEDWVVTLPKVTSVDQVTAMLQACTVLEDELGLRENSLRFEIQIETPQSILGAGGTALVARMVHVAGRRLTGLHYGTYDYSAFCGIAAAQQSLEHPVADHAKLVMQAAVAGTGVRLSDGSTHVLPVGDAEAVAAAWAHHYRLVRRALERGYYQGWDLHPAQLPTRYAATYSFYRDGLPRALTRLADYAGSARTEDPARTARAVVDEPATARPRVVRAARTGLRRG